MYTTKMIMYALRLGLPKHGLDGLAACTEAIPKDGAWARVQSGRLGDRSNCVCSPAQRSNFERFSCKTCRTAQCQVLKVHC